MIKKLTLATLLLFIGFSANAQDEEPKYGWETEGKFTFLINQSAFSNWLAGGENSIAGNVNLDYRFDFNTEKWSLKQRIQASYGLTKIETSDFVKKKQMIN